MAPVKYTFDRTFGDEAKQREAQDRAAFEQEVRAAEERGRNDGIQIGRQQAMGELEAQISAASKQIAETCQQLFEQREELTSRIEQQTAQLAYAIASRLAPALMDRHPTAEIEALVSECLEFCQREPRIVVRVADPLVDPMKERLDTLKLSKGFMGDVILLGDPSLQGHDCRVEWPDGGVERAQHDVEANIEAAIQRFVMASTDDGPVGAGAPVSQSAKI